MAGATEETKAVTCITKNVADVFMGSKIFMGYPSRNSKLSSEKKCLANEGDVTDDGDFLIPHPRLTSAMAGAKRQKATGTPCLAVDPPWPW